MPLYRFVPPDRLHDWRSFSETECVDEETAVRLAGSLGMILISTLEQDQAIALNAASVRRRSDEAEQDRRDGSIDRIAGRVARRMRRESSS